MTERRFQISLQRLLVAVALFAVLLWGFISCWRAASGASPRAEASFMLAGTIFLFLSILVPPGVAVAGGKGAVLALALVGIAIALVWLAIVVATIWVGMK